MANVQLAVAGDETTQVILSVPGVQGPAGSNLPPSGTTNQVLYKQSSTDYDTAWSLVTSAMITDGTIVNGDINASAAIAGTKISPDFGSQNVVTTGTATAASFIPTSSGVPTNGLYLPSANNVAISTGGSGKLVVNSTGTVNIVGAGSAGSTQAVSFNGGAPVNSLVLTSGGLLGVGTSGPSVRFQVQASIAGGSDGTVATLHNVSDTGGDTRYVGLNFRIGSDDGTSAIRAYRTNSANNYETNLSFWTNPAGATQTPLRAMTIDSYQRVGIGTSSPQSAVDVLSGVRGVPETSGSTTSVTTLRLRGSSNGVLDIGELSSAAAGSYWLQVRDRTDLGYSYNLALQPNGGAVGIGTTSPAGIFEACGSSSYFRPAGAAGTFLQITAGAANGDVTLTASANSGNYPPLVFSTGGGEKIRIDSSGRLLVGTSSTSNIHKLVVRARTDDSNGNGGLILMRGSTPSASGQAIGFIGFTDQNDNNGAWILAESDGSWTSGSNHRSRLVFSVTPDGGSSPTTSPSAMTINSGQEVLIGYSTDNGAYKLQVNSQIFATSATIATSDGRYKENVVTLDGCVDLVKALRPVSFDWKAQQPITRVDEDGETVVVREAHNFPDGKQVGFIAQEVEKVLADKPWLGSVIKQNVRPAVTDNDGNELAPEEEFLGIAEGNLVAVLTSALKDAIGRIESLEADVAAIKA